jgi:hypothetical protein
MYCNELKPVYVECSEKTWNEARPRSLTPKELPTVANLVIIEYSRVNIFLDIIISNSKHINLFTCVFLAFE